jgi:hypothetical protein
MTNITSGGDGMPSSPEASLEPWSPPTGTQDKNVFDSDPSGNEEELNLGVAAMSAPMPEREENTPQKLVLGLPSVKEVPEEEGKEETEESLPKEAMDLEKTHDDAHDGVSLASLSAKDVTSSLAKAFQASTVANPPCHQTMMDSQQEESKMEGEDEQGERAETATLMPSVSDVAMKEYQMKLLVPKKNEEEYLYTVVKQMMMNHWGMGIHAYVPLSANANPEIESFDDLPDTDEGREPYFRSIQDKRNKKGTSIVFHIITEYSHVEWRKYMEKEAQELQLYVGIHKLESTKTEIIGFIAQKHPEMIIPTDLKPH